LEHSVIDRDFRDQHHVEKIRERLWVGREIGRAAVMVGAGFSRNAQRSSSEVPIFPLWGEIAEKMYDALYPPGSLAEAPRKKDKARRIAVATRLASEYETTFGRQALDDLLNRTIPDERYEPGSVHQTLLSLPWSDVFTTNYDTLLERTRSVVQERKYDLILAPSDIPAQSRPRIVKLHGSFPSHGPFVITEEDFRTYPTQSATFVNLVQQSIMENAFCLLGFSGDDPNFLSWTGWVRDNLGSSVPPVYLAGLLDLSGSQRRLLEEARRVTPIDLSPLFPASDWPDPLERHNRAMEWFLLNLAEGQPPKVDHWPVPSPPEPRTSSEGLPCRPEGPRPVPDPGPRMPRVAQQTTTRDLGDLLEKWIGSRESYPGWQLAPYSNRTALWDRTELWIQPVLESARELDVPKDLLLLFELNWRLEKSLVPLFSDWAGIVHSSLEAYNPSPSLIDVPDATIRPDVAEYRGLDWDGVAWRWVELAFALARAAREGQDEADFRYWMDLLSNLRGRRSDWRARWFYEECLFHLSRLDQVAVRSTLNDWTEDPSLPLWQVKRAGILIELGDLQAAEQITERAVETVRSRMQPYHVDRTLMSHEALALMLLEGIKANGLGVDEGLLAGYRDRLQDLERYGCNPWAEIERFEGTVVGVAPPLRQWRQDVVPAFDPGRQRPSMSTCQEGSASIRYCPLSRC
jgi:hypothetical protein